MRHVNIPVFIPHLGCPNLCVFCNQKSISGKTDCREETIVSDADKTIGEAIQTLAPDDEVEIAFFGGSFTGIGNELMTALLDVAQKYINCGRAKTIRMSTRPDYISDDILCILRNYSVKYIELGIQSMDDNVLKKCKRGHTSVQSMEAVALIKKYGFLPVGQMMTGLPGATEESELFTASEIVRSGCVGARIYPTMVFAHTELENMVFSGEYTPPTLENAVSRTAAVLDIFLRAGLDIYKIGLHSGEALYGKDGISCGEYHPAMGELVEARIMLQRISSALDGKDTVGKFLHLMVAKGFTSKTVGQRGYNKSSLINKFGLKRITVTESESIPPYGFDYKLGETAFEN